MKNIQSKLGVMALNLLLVLGLFSSTVALTGCNNQATVAALVSTLGNAASSIASLEGNPVLAEQLKEDTAAASTAVLNWKSGTPAENVIQLLTIVQQDLSLFPIDSQYQALVTLALGTVVSILTIIEANSPPQVASDAVRGVNRHVRSVVLANPPKNSDQFKKQWNNIVSRHPELSDAKLY